MQVVYEADHVIDAHLVLHALQDAGIPAYVRGEALLGGLGELGVFGLVAVCVPSACWPEARAVVEALGLGDAAPEPRPTVRAWPDPRGAGPAAIRDGPEADCITLRFPQVADRPCPRSSSATRTTPPGRCAPGCCCGSSA